MDIKENGFNDDFSIFRNRMKELDKRLGSVISQSYDDNNSLMARFKLFDSFEELLLRKIIQEDCERKYMLVLEQYRCDLKKVQSIFIEQKALIDSHDENSPLPRNMPPATGAISWTKGLLDRIQ